MTEINTTKKCPYCAEQIQQDAIVCRYCNHGLINPNIANDITPDGIKLLTEKGKILSREVTGRLNQGWILISQTDNAAQMTKPKTFNWVWFIIWLVVGIFVIEIPLFIYLIMYFVRKPELVTLTVNDKMQILINGVPPYVPVPAKPLTPEEEATKKKSMNTALTIVAVVIAGIILVCIASVVISALVNSGNAPVGAVIQTLAQFA